MWVFPLYVGLSDCSPVCLSDSVSRIGFNLSNLWKKNFHLDNKHQLWPNAAIETFHVSKNNQNETFFFYFFIFSFFFCGRFRDMTQEHSPPKSEQWWLCIRLAGKGAMYHMLRGDIEKKFHWLLTIECHLRAMATIHLAVSVGRYVSNTLRTIKKVTAVLWDIFHEKKNFSSFFVRNGKSIIKWSRCHKSHEFLPIISNFMI